MCGTLCIAVLVVCPDRRSFHSSFMVIEKVSTFKDIDQICQFSTALDNSFVDASRWLNLIVKKFTFWTLEKGSCSDAR